MKKDALAGWRTALIRAGDRAFHDLMRNYLGPIRTPFNKHDLIARLEAFLARPEIIEAIWDDLQPDQIIIVCSLARLGAATPEHLREFIGPELEPLAFYNALSQLEDRLLVYKSENQLRLLPQAEVPQDILAAWQPFPRLPAVQPAEMHCPWPWLNDTSAVGLLLLIQAHGQNRLKANGNLQKRFAATLSSKLGGFLDGQTGDVPRAPLALRALQLCGLLDDELEPQQNRLLEWASMTPIQRSLRLWGAAGVALSDDFSEDLNHRIEPTFFDLQNADWLAGVIGAVVRGIQSLAAAQSTALPLLPDSSIRRMLGPLCSDYISAQWLLEMLIEMGVFLRSGRGLFLTPVLAARSAGLAGLAGSGLPADLQGANAQADGSFILSPGAPLDVLMKLRELFSLERSDNVLRIRMESAGAAKLFRRGWKAAEISAELAALCGAKLPQSIPAMLADWERQQATYRVRTGILIQASSATDAQAALAAMRTGGLQAQVIGEQTLFLQTNSAGDQAIAAQLAAAARAGIDLENYIEIPKEQDLPAYFGELYIPKLPFLEFLQQEDSLEAAALTKAEEDAHAAARTLRARRAASRKQEMFERLRGLNLGQDLSREIEMRIAAGIILDPVQMHRGIARSEQTRAEGLDHTGKLRLIEAALEAVDYLEIEYRPLRGAAADPSAAPAGERGLEALGPQVPAVAAAATGSVDVRNILLLPSQLRGRGVSAELVATTVPDNRELYIPVSRIQSVRRLRSGLFK